MPRIRLLPDHVINQIAAGEVVERPASVVKELVENSLDAQATAIRVLLTAGGRDLIVVEDNGCGMDSDDALLAIERHATSKLSTAEGLTSLTTLGFRGEALPSIAAVSRLTLETAPADGEGTRIEVDHGTVLSVEPCGRRRGTTVRVGDLLARLPARRKFLRSEGTELRHAITVLTGLAYANPGVGISLQHGTRTLLDLPPVREPELRLPDLVSPRRATLGVPFHHRNDHVAVRGVLLPSGGSHDIYVLVNGRLARDRAIAGAINRALRNAAGVPEADLFVHITLDSADVDVNVHPAKTEVRFAQPGAVISALTQAIATARVRLHGPADVHRLVPAGPAAGAASPPMASLFAGPYRIPAFVPTVREDRLPGYEELPTPLAPPTMTRYGRLIGQYRETYLLIEDAEGLLLVDQHAAHERVLYEALLAAAPDLAMQRLLLPEIVELPPRLAALAQEALPTLESLGVEAEPASATTLRVLSVPGRLGVAAAGALVLDTLADIANDRAPGTSLRERVAASLACHAAIKKNRVLPRAEAESLLADLAGLADPHRCPHGRPTMLRLSHAEIERRIGRR